MESIEKEVQRIAMLTKRMMETPLPEPPMMESDRASAKRRRRTRNTPFWDHLLVGSEVFCGSWMASAT